MTPPPMVMEVAVFGYSTLKPGDLEESSYPALALTMRVTNRGAAATTADFMLTLPFGASILYMCRDVLEYVTHERNALSLCGQLVL